MKLVSLSLLFFLGVSVVEGFSVNISRRQWLEGAIAVAVAHPVVVHADVTSRVASSSALRTVKRALKQLNTLESYVSTEDFEGLRTAIRVAPLSETRKSCNVLIKGGGPDEEKLSDTYKSFIGVLEEFDSTAGLAVRGRKIPDGKMMDLYKVTVSALENFVAVAEESTAQPSEDQETETE